MQKLRRRSQEDWPWVSLAPPCNTPTTIFRKDFDTEKNSSLLLPFALGVSNTHQTRAVGSRALTCTFFLKRSLPGDFTERQQRSGTWFFFSNNFLVEGTCAWFSDPIIKRKYNFFGGWEGVEDCVTTLKAGVGKGHKAQEYKVQLQL